MLSKIVVNKSETLETRGETRPYISAWRKIEFTLEHILQDGEDPQLIKDALLMQIDAWIREEKEKWLSEVRRR